MSGQLNNTQPTSTAPTQNQDRLRALFTGTPIENYSTVWDGLWRDGDFLPWDRGLANPALIDTLNAKPQWLGTSTHKDGKRRRAFVPGCGTGYDVAVLAAHGYDTYGLEVSENAQKAATKWLESKGAEQEGDYKTKDEKVGRGVTKVVKGDFFKDDWADETGGVGDGFDLIYDITFLCALPPDLRASWAARMVQLLAPGGVLICLEFPTHKPPKSGGPPWALPSEVYQELLKRPGEELLYDDELKVIKQDKPESDDALVRVAYWKPERTAQVGIINGEVKDRVSAWKHKGAA